LKTIYIETSVISYLTARPSDNLLASAWQKATVDWWETQRGRFSLYTSALVLEEAWRGNSNASQKRLEVLKDIPLLETTDAAIALAKIFLEQGTLPPKAIDDAVHIALAIIHEMDYLLTWNCRHIDNAEIKPVIRTLCMSKNLHFPEICTPQELMGA
jgi:predicted nucleic acid-binding protein